jgi:hypothetical protein
MGTPKTIDMTPTWASILPILLAAIQDGNSTGRGAAIEELYRMAQAADQWNIHVASLKEQA